MPAINGFAVSEIRSQLGVRMFRVPGTQVSLPVRADVAPLLIGFALEFHRTVEPLVRGWCWGYAYRAVRGASSFSFHAAGIAADLNAPDHPLGARGTFTPAQATQIRRLCKKYGLRWGGDYRKRADEMHVEVIVSRAEALALVARLQAKPPVKADSGSPVLRVGASGTHVKHVQSALRKSGAKVDVDGLFGPGTDRALRALQARHNIVARGYTDSATWLLLRRIAHAR